MLEIDGSYGEGGGSIVRHAFGLAAVTGKEIKISDIRQGRSVSGLKEQHLQAIRAVAKLCSGAVKGDKLGSSEVSFKPGSDWKSKLKVKIGTAGSVGLLLQAVMLPCFFSGKKVEVEIKGGGTLGLHAPNLLYTSEVLLPMIKKFGYSGSIEIKRHGFYPKGGADVVFRSSPCSKVSGFNLLERGKVESVRGISLSSDHLKNARVAERMSKSALDVLKDFDVKISKEYVSSFCPGAGILLIGEFPDSVIGWDALGLKGKPAEAVGLEAGKGFLEQVNSGGVIDDYMVDQILSFLAFSKESSKFRVNKVSKHAETNMWLIKKFFDVDFKISKNIVEVLKKR